MSRSGRGKLLPSQISNIYIYFSLKSMLVKPEVYTSIWIHLYSVPGHEAKECTCQTQIRISAELLLFHVYSC